MKAKELKEFLKSVPDDTPVGRMAAGNAYNDIDRFFEYSSVSYALGREGSKVIFR